MGRNRAGEPLMNRVCMDERSPNLGFAEIARLFSSDGRTP